MRKLTLNHSNRHGLVATPDGRRRQVLTRSGPAQANGGLQADLAGSERRQVRSKWHRPSLVALAAMTWVSQAQAQVSEPQKPQRVEVTGTSIKRTDTETASPLRIIRAEEIERSGVTSVSELLRLLPGVTGGGQDEVTRTAFSPGVATASLRGLGSASTLTLINGRRMAATATANPNAGQSTLYNVNDIPLSAIERVEVLKDGASAVYGSDAIGGVVNFILKKEFKGLEMSVRHSGAEQGDFVSRGASFFGGFGDFNAGRFNVMVGLDLNERKATPIGRTKGFNFEAWQITNQGADGSLGELSAPDSQNTFSPVFYRETGVNTGLITTSAPVRPVNCVAPSVLSSDGAFCEVDLSSYERHVQPSRRTSVFARGSWNVDGNIVAAVEASFTRLENQFSSAPTAIDRNLSTWFDRQGNRRTFRGWLPANHPDNPLFQSNPNNNLRVAMNARYADIPSGEEVTQDSSRLVLDLSGVHQGWDWRGGLLHNSSERKTIETGEINSLTALQGLAAYRFGRTNSPEVLNLISPTLVSLGKTSVSIFDLKGSSEFGQLPGGKIGLALGIEHRRESIDIRPDALLNNGDIVNRGIATANGSRNVSSGFAEVALPLFKSLDVEAAVRFDEYSDYGSSATPKLGIKWKPWDQLVVRATAADSFRAPGLTQISNSNVTSFQTINTWRDTARCPLVGGVPTRIAGATGYETNECTSRTVTRRTSSLIIANTQLQPETARSYTFGLVYAPTSKFSATFDLYQISRKNEIDRLNSNNIMERFFQNGEAQYRDDIVRSPDPSSALTAGGQRIAGTEPVVGVRRKFQNLGETIVRGADLEMSYRYQLSPGVRANSNLFLGYSKDFLFQREKGLPFVQQADSVDDESPTYKGSFSTDIDFGALSVTGTVNYVSSMAVTAINSTTGVRSDCDPSIGDDPVQAALLGGDCRVDAFTTVDAGFSYRPTKGLRLTATIRNLLNRRAPYDPSAAYFNSEFHNAQGRAYTLRLTYKFQ